MEKTYNLLQLHYNKYRGIDPLYTAEVDLESPINDNTLLQKSIKLSQNI